jgi:hypothetical protein
LERPENEYLPEESAVAEEFAAPLRVTVAPLPAAAGVTCPERLNVWSPLPTDLLLTSPAHPVQRPARMEIARKHSKAAIDGLRWSKIKFSSLEVGLRIGLFKSPGMECSGASLELAP